jgi:tetratricopeptide (TPR) repeat protein
MSDPANASGVVRVFVSSTFRDMQAERDELVKHVFPALRKLCEQRGLAWGEVDLRWGVTAEQAERGEVVPICLAEIDRCPFFLGLLGERYGWVPDALSADLLAERPWLRECPSRSVTELEVEHGVLRDPRRRQGALFYFRSPDHVRALPAGEAAGHVEGPSPKEIEQHGQAEAVRRAERRRQQLQALKERIRTSRLALREDYPSPQVLGEWVLRDFTALIDRLYPQGAAPDPLDREAADHEAFADSRSGTYVGRARTFELLDGAGQSVVVLGDSGVGKSALLANWARRRRQAHPGDLVIQHFIGSTPASVDWASLVRRIMGEMQRRFGLPGAIPDQPDALRSAFLRWLHQAAARGRVVLVLDALDKLDDRDGARDLLWLPGVLPANVRLVASTLPGRPLDEIRKRGWPALTVVPLSFDERCRLTEDYLRQYAKALARERVARIASAEQAGNPLYLRALLEELRLHGDHFTLDQRIGHYLAATTPEALYGRILQRYEQDYDRDRPGLVGEAMALLWVARRGLAEAELLDLLGAGDAPLPRAVWSPLYLAMESALVSRQGLLGFSHDYLRAAVEKRYLSTPGQRQAVHQRLADYFRRRDFTRRSADEAPWQLAEAEDWKSLAHWLCTPQTFIGTWGLSHFDVCAWWARIEATSPLRMVEEYRRVLDDPAAMSLSHRTGEEEQVRTMYATLVAGLFQTTGHLAEAQELHARLAAQAAPEGMETFQLGAAANQALILYQQGNLAAALEIARQQEERARAGSDRAALAASLRVQALVAEARGELDGALAMHREIELLSRELHDKDWVAQALSNQATILHTRGGWNEATALYKAAEALCREVGKPDQLASVLANQATLLQERGDHRAALPLLREQEAACRQANDQAGLARSLANQGTSLRNQGDIDGALELWKQAAAICRQMGNREELAQSLGNQANVHCDLNDHASGLALFKEQEAICRELGVKDGLAVCLGNQGDCYLARRDYDAALAVAREQERLCREVGNRRLLAVCLRNQALLLFEGYGRKEEALARGEEALKLFSALGYAPDVMQTEMVLRNIRIGLTQRMGRALMIVVPLVVAALGVGLGLLNPWLWLLGGPVALLALGVLAFGLVFRFAPRLRLRIMGAALQANADTTEAASGPVASPFVGQAGSLSGCDRRTSKLPVPRQEPATGPVAATPGLASEPLAPGPEWRLADDFKLEGGADIAVPRTAPKVGRNDPCPCGSGKKYKNCHMKIPPR